MEDYRSHYYVREYSRNFTANDRWGFRVSYFLGFRVNFLLWYRNLNCCIIARPVDMYEMAVLSAMCTILGLTASEYPSAAMNIFFGYSVIVVSLILRDRLAPRMFLVDNKDAYLFVCRVGYIFVAKGAIIADKINQNLLKHKKTVTFKSNWR
jgi:hypothetical protein